MITLAINWGYALLVTGVGMLTVFLLLVLFGHGLTPEEVKDHMNCSLIGEVTIPDTFRP